MGWARSSGWRREEWLLPALLYGLVLFAFAMRVSNLDYQSFWRDEVDAVLFARESLPSLLAKFASVGENGPMYFLVLHYWIGLVGDSEFSVRFFSLVFGVITVPLIFAVGNLIVGRWTGVTAAVIATLSPYHIWYSQEAKMYSLLAALTLLSVYLFLKALHSGRPIIWILYIVATSVALYVHFFAALVLLGEGAIFVANFGLYRSRLRGVLISVAFLTLPYVPLAAWQIPMLVTPPPSPYELLSLPEMATTLLSVFSVGEGSGNAAVLTLFIFLLLCAAILGRGEASPCSRRPIANVFLFMLAPLAGFYVVSLRYPLFTERYLIIVLFAFQILLGAGLLAIGRRSKMLFVACATLIAVVSWMDVYHFQHTPVKADFRAAVRYFEANAGESDAIMAVMPYMRRSFDYYHRGSYQWVDPPYANQGVTGDEVSRALKEAVGGIGRLWLFVAEEDFWDNRALVRGWLDSNGRLRDEKEFVGVRLLYYELP
ncbi:MAG: glycosyltransferase family 39 protein [Dehalococcoidia bacterium]|nr:glycosyltransferase family 39 protein [Dehalococcoidia bacterium]